MHSASDSFPYPRGNVVGVIVDDTSMQAVCERLAGAGFGADRVAVLHGEEGLARIDVSGEAHGTKGGIMRRLQRAIGDEGDDPRRYADHLRAGHYIVAADCEEDEGAKRRAAEAFHAMRAESVHYYDENYVEDLGANV